jgi:hypothetical protein
MVLVGEAAEVQLEGRRRPEPGRLYAAMQANSLAAEDATSQMSRCMQYRRGVDRGGDVMAEGENRWALVYSDIKRCRTRNSGYEHQLAESRWSDGEIVRRRGVYSSSCVMSSMTITTCKDRRRGMGAATVTVCRPCCYSQVLTASIGAGSTRLTHSAGRYGLNNNARLSVSDGSHGALIGSPSPRRLHFLNIALATRGSGLLHFTTTTTCWLTDCASLGLTTSDARALLSAMYVRLGQAEQSRFRGLQSAALLSIQLVRSVISALVCPYHSARRSSWQEKHHIARIVPESSALYSCSRACNT